MQKEEERGKEVEINRKREKWKETFRGGKEERRQRRRGRRDKGGGGDDHKERDGGELKYRKKERRDKEVGGEEGYTLKKIKRKEEDIERSNIKVQMKDLLKGEEEG